MENFIFCPLVFVARAINIINFFASCILRWGVIADDSTSIKKVSHHFMTFEDMFENLSYAYLEPSQTSTMELFYENSW